MTDLYQLALDHSIVNCGMSYVIQLNSGNFILIDGGYFTPGEADNLVRFLIERCNKRPVIDNWFFTHAHQDHVGVFINMITHHRDALDIRNISLNIQPLALPETSEGWDIKGNALPTVKRFYEALDICRKSTQIQTVHTGDCWKEEELEMEILYCHEDLAEKEPLFNDCSTVLRISCNGVTAVFSGDLEEKGCHTLLSNQKERLKCDILQIPHHGLSDGPETASFYHATSPHIVLWPTGEKNMNRVKQNATNRILLDNPNIENYFSWQGTKRFSIC